MPTENQQVNRPDQSIPKSEEDLKTNKPEQEISLESAENVAELLNLWLKESQETEDQGEKSELAYCLIKMKMALGLAKLNPEEVKIKDYDAGTGTLGYYLPSSGEVGITPEGLNLPPEHFADVLVHEAEHKGTVTAGRRIFDEGFTELLTKKLVPNALTGYYTAEKTKALKVFNETEMAEALKKYDFDKPMVLVAYYLGTEWKDRWDKDLKGDYLKQKTEASFNEDEYLAGVLTDNKDIEKTFKQGVPDIYHKVKEQGFDDFDKLGLEILKHLLKQERS
ncbi:MAG: hypothetical protein NTZ18_00795 [Candidatus Komeilibacteria bacterium]|nr:hypothetical protein [Candidatus Komeilibacteria bacterium]